jgi:hypothetical protein
VAQPLIAAVIMDIARREVGFIAVTMRGADHAIASITFQLHGGICAIGRRGGAHRFRSVICIAWMIRRTRCRCPAVALT